MRVHDHTHKSNAPEFIPAWHRSNVRILNPPSSTRCSLPLITASSVASCRSAYAKAHFANYVHCRFIPCVFGRLPMAALVPRLLAARRRRAARVRAGRAKPVFLGAVKKVGAWSGRPGVGLRQGRRRERNVMAEIQKFRKMLSRAGGHGKSFGFAVSHPFTGKDDTMARTHYYSKRAAFKAEF